MLLSPGHSPRQISSPSPSPSLSSSQSLSLQNPNSSSSSILKTPKSKNTVLDEDTYVAAIEKIIEQDFFPDIAKLKDRLDWLEAVRSRDPVQIRDAQLKIIERRRGKTSNLSTSEGDKSKTPGSTFFARSITPFELSDKTPITDFSNVNDSNNNCENNIGLDENWTLDQFFRRYTSEDNASFSKILERVNRKRKERYGYLRDGENDDAKLIEHAKRDRITDGYGTSGQPVSTLESWKYTAKNLLMYHPADRGEVALTDEERVERIKGLTKEIDRSNTRFHGKMLDSRPREEDTVAVLYTPVPGATPVPLSLSEREADKLKKYDLEDLRKTPNQFYVESGKKAENGYSYVKTPSPAPGADESPFITWGDIEGTPLRLDPEDTPIDIGGSGDGPHFKMPCPPSRDVKARSLSREAARKLKERSKMFQKPPLPSPMRGGSASPSIRALSPAAQKFVRNAIAKSSSSVDETLRASYRGGSPGLSTPKSGRSISRFGRDTIRSSRPPSVREGSSGPW
ncbi:Nuclear protein DGCR14/ESS-2 [Dillenia turbinata]|uniref:Nuclear protein DGCR14/ESS-2 n=1 Tax=Dillenia turbinata TaxID=194707 RepID=A0AAN8YZD2_9MAGN